MMRLDRIAGHVPPFLVALAVWVLIAVACGTTDVPPPVPQSESPAPASSAAAPGPGLETSAPTPIPPLSVPTPTVPIFHPLVNPLSLVSPSIEEQILTSAVIVRASLLSATAGTETVPSGGGVAPTYRPLQELRFRAHEYLKGTGPSEALVVVRGDHTYLTEAEALQAATTLVSDRNTTWDGREGVLFLNNTSPRHIPAGASDDEESGARAPGATPAPAFAFTLSNYGTQTEWEYTVDTLSRAWLPAMDSEGASDDAARSSDLPAPVFITDGTQSPPPVITLVELRSSIAEIDAMLQAGTSAEYKKCVYHKITRERHYRLVPYTPHLEAVTLASGSEAGTEVYRHRFSQRNDAQYFNLWLSGPDPEFFGAVIVDADSDASNGYDDTLTISRPLISGQYRVFYNLQHFIHIPCNSKPADAYIDVTITVTAPTGTLHEAFFDPGATGGGVGFSSATGSMEPAGFAVGGAAAAIGGLLWRDGSAILTLAPYAALTTYDLDFIALDGSVSLTLTGLRPRRTAPTAH